MTLKKIISLNTVVKKNRNNLCNSYSQQFKHMNPLGLPSTKGPLKKEHLLTLLVKNSPPVQLHNKDNNTYSVKNTSHKTSIKNLKDKANNGDTSAIQQLITKYTNGDGVVKSNTKAFFWHEKLAEKGNAQQQYIFGAMNAYKDDDPKNKRIAIKWYKKAASQNYKPAIIALNNLAKFYRESKNYEMAIECYQIGADKGNTDSQYYLGLLYTAGYDEVPPDNIKALNLFEKAASKGDLASQYIIKNTKNSKDVPEPEDTKHTSSQVTPTSFFKNKPLSFKIGIVNAAIGFVCLLLSFILEYLYTTQKKT